MSHSTHRHAGPRIVDSIARTAATNVGSAVRVEPVNVPGANARGSLRAAHVAEEFRETGSLLVEAVEEPSSIAGWEVTKLSYVGLEPWIVLLRNEDERVRYVVVVMPDGTISGALRVPFLPFESMFLRPVS